MSTYCLENANILLLHTLHQTHLPYHRTLAVLLVVGDRNCLVEQYKSGTIVIPVSYTHLTLPTTERV